VSERTVAAISTPIGEGGISLIRVSGRDAIEICDKIFKSVSGKRLESLSGYTALFGHIMGEDGPIDEAVVTVFREPKSYTGEDVCEISCHGGRYVTSAVLEAVLSAGALSAGPGEFTKRAFLNGKLDLAKAESVIDIINSKTSLEEEISVNNLGGALSGAINSIRERIIALIANIGVLIDYPDEGLEPFGDDEFYEELRAIREELQKLYDTSSAGMVLREGIPTVIVGKPNVGKSSLFNLLSGEERAIVTEIEGTTRDALEEYIVLGDVTLRLADTAGIRDTEDQVEKIGVKKALEYIEKSSLIIFMADAVSGIDEKDLEIINAIEDKKVIALINKTDSADLKDAELLRQKFDKVIEFSVKDKKGIDKLKGAVSELFNLGDIASSDISVITNARHRDAIFKAICSVDSAIEAQKMLLGADTSYIDLEAAASSLGEIVGLTVSEEVVDRIFHKFCIGK